MRHLPAALLTAAILAIAGPAASQDAATDFVTANGHERVTVEEFMERYREALPGDESSALLPDAGMGPIEKALVFVDAVEGELPRARWLYRYGQTVEQGSTGRDTTLYFIDVARFNLGPAIHAETVEAYGAENTDTPEAFGAGPTLSWRLVMSPVMGMTADIVEAGRREWTDEQAQGAMCFGQPCLSTAGLIDGLGAWDDIDAPPDAPRPYEPMQAGRLAGLAGALHGFDAASGRFTMWSQPEKPERIGTGADPFIGGLIETGLGQDPASEIAMVNAGLNDDEIRDLWFRVVDFGGALSAGRHTVPWPRQ